MKVAIVHDYLNQRGGAERVVAVLHEMFPEAPIYTTIVDRENLWPELASADIRSSWMQRLPGMRRHFKKYLPLYPRAIESFDLKGYDLLISSSSAFAKGAIKGKDALHICYCYTPMRFTWDYENYQAREHLNFLARGALPFLIGQLKRWDWQTRLRPDYYVAISTAVQKRIQKIYGLQAEIVFPPIDAGRFAPREGRGEFYLVVSRLNSYKRIDLAVEAFNRLGLPLKVIGTGPFLAALREMARPNVEFLGGLPDREVAAHYASCRALILPGEEDFGIAPLEANAAGRPVIAFKGGGALDTIAEGVNGIFFAESRVESLMEAVKVLESGRHDFRPGAVRAHALQFDKNVFQEKMGRLLREKYALWQKGQGRRGGGESLAGRISAPSPSS